MYVAVIESLQDSPNVNEPPTLPEVTNGSTTVNEDSTSIPKGSYTAMRVHNACMHACMHAYMHT